MSIYDLEFKDIFYANYLHDLTCIEVMSTALVSGFLVSQFCHYGFILQSGCKYTNMYKNGNNT